MTATAYAVNDFVFESDKLYVCLVAHTSATFATDLATGKWEELVDFTSIVTDAEAAATEAEGYKDLAQAAASAAQGHADDAETAQTAAEAAAAAAAADVLEQFSAGNAEWYGDAIGTNAYSVAFNDFSPAVRTDGQKFRCRIPNGNTGNVSMTVGDYTGASVVRHNGAEIASGHWPAACIVEFSWSESLGKYVWNDGTPTTLMPFLAGNNTFSGANVHNGLETFKRAVRIPTVLTPASTVAVDMSTGDNFTLTLDQNTILGAPSNTTNGQEGTIEVAEDGTGGWTFTLNAVWKPIGGDALKIDTGASKKTVIGYHVVDSSNILYWRVWSEVRKPIGSYVDYDKSTFANSTSYTQNHGLGRYPSKFETWIECTSADANYAVGDRILLASASDSDTSARSVTQYMNTTLVGCRTGGNSPTILDSSFSGTVLTASKWKVIFRVYD